MGYWLLVIEVFNGYWLLTFQCSMVNDQWSMKEDSTLSTFNSKLPLNSKLSTLNYQLSTFPFGENGDLNDNLLDHGGGGDSKLWHVPVLGIEDGEVAGTKGEG